MAKPSTTAWLTLSVLLVAQAGCLGTGDVSEDEEQDAGSAATATADPVPELGMEQVVAVPQRTVANWTGYLKVGAADEAPNHVDETNGATGGVWSTSFHYEAAKAPMDLVVWLNWTATAAQIEFMVVVPVNDAIVETGFADHGPLCGRIPAKLLAPGTYSIMAHSQVAVDARLAFSVVALGGDGRLVDHAHSAPASAFPGYLADLVAGKDGETTEPQRCGTS